VAANISDMAMGAELLAGVAGWTLADRNYGTPRLAAQAGGCRPTASAMTSPTAVPPWLVGKRRWVET
jgi:hypothetical protein